MSSSSINHVSSGGSPSVIPSVDSGSEKQQGCLGKLASKVNSLFYSIIAMIKSCWHESHGVFKIVPPLALLVGGASLTFKKLFSSSPGPEKEIVTADEKEIVAADEREAISVAHEKKTEASQTERAMPDPEKEIVAADEKEIVAADEREAISVAHEKKTEASQTERAMPDPEKEIVAADEKEIVAADEREAISVAHEKKTEASQAERAKRDKQTISFEKPRLSDFVRAGIAPPMVAPTMAADISFEKPRLSDFVFVRAGIAPPMIAPTMAADVVHDKKTEPSQAKRDKQISLCQKVGDFVIKTMTAAAGTVLFFGGVVFSGFVYQLINRQVMPLTDTDTGGIRMADMNSTIVLPNSGTMISP